MTAASKSIDHAIDTGAKYVSDSSNGPVTNFKRVGEVSSEQRKQADIVNKGSIEQVESLAKVTIIPEIQKMIYERATDVALVNLAANPAATGLHPVVEEALTSRINRGVFSPEAKITLAVTGNKDLGRTQEGKDLMERTHNARLHLSLRVDNDKAVVAAQVRDGSIEVRELAVTTLVKQEHSQLTMQEAIELETRVITSDRSIAIRGIVARYTTHPEILKLILEMNDPDLNMLLLLNPLLGNEVKTKILGANLRIVRRGRKIITKSR